VQAQLLRFTGYCVITSYSFIIISPVQEAKSLIFNIVVFCMPMIDVYYLETNLLFKRFAKGLLYYLIYDLDKLN
jgi:hypothetical protein